MEIRWKFNASEKRLEFEIFSHNEAEQTLLRLCEYKCPTLNYDYGTEVMKFNVRLDQE